MITPAGSFIDNPSSASSASANITGDTHPVSPAAIDDEFEAGSLSGSWTQVNSPTVTLVKGSAILTQTGTGSNNIQLIVKTPPSTPYTVGAKVIWNSITANGSAGMVLRESGTGKLIILLEALGSVHVQWWNSPTSFNTDRFSATMSNWVQGLPRYFAIVDDGANLNYEVSWDGISFKSIFSESRTAFFAGAPNQIGVYSNQSDAVIAQVDVDWFRQLA